MSWLDYLEKDRQKLRDEGNLSPYDAVQAMKNNESAMQQLKAGIQGLNDRTKAANQQQLQNGLKNGSLGAGLASTIVSGATTEAGAAFGTPMLSAAVQGVGDLVGGVLQGMSRSSRANAAMNQAGAMAEAQNIQARRQLMEQADSQFGQMNEMNAVAGARMGGAAIGQAGQFENAAAAIGQSGISGSKNMERNLQYGRDRADAEQQLQFDLMGNSAEQVQNSMAQSFDELSQGKAGAMIDAFTGTAGSLIAQQNASKTAMGEQDRQLRPAKGDVQQVVIDASKHLTQEEKDAMMKKLGMI